MTRRAWGFEILVLPTEARFSEWKFSQFVPKLKSDYRRVRAEKNRGLLGESYVDLVVVGAGVRRWARELEALEAQAVPKT